MFAFFLVILIIDSVVLATVVLLQSGKGGGLAAMGGGASTDSFLGGRQAVTVLTKMSWWCGGIFLGLSLLLAGMSASGGAPRSVLEGQIAPPTPVNVAPFPLDIEPEVAEPATTPAPEDQTPPTTGTPPGGND